MNTYIYTHIYTARRTIQRAAPQNRQPRQPIVSTCLCGHIGCFPALVHADHACRVAHLIYFGRRVGFLRGSVWTLVLCMCVKWVGCRNVQLNLHRQTDGQPFERQKPIDSVMMCIHIHIHTPTPRPDGGATHSPHPPPPPPPPPSYTHAHTHTYTTCIHIRVLPSLRSHIL